MEKIVLVVCLVIALVAFVIGVLQFKQKGLLLNNTYLYASKEQREKMDKKPYYRQSGVVFFGIGTIFLFNGVQCLVEADWPFQLVVGITICTLVYAVVSSYVIDKRIKRAAKAAEKAQQKQNKKNKKKR